MKPFHHSLAAVLLFSLAACGGGSPLSLNPENFAKVQEGMSAAEVQTIMGPPSDSKSEPIPVVGGTKTTFTYSNRKNGDTATIILKNDTVQSKEGRFPSAKN